jgi:hypothetical protein
MWWKKLNIKWIILSTIILTFHILTIKWWTCLTDLRQGIFLLGLNVSNCETELMYLAKVYVNFRLQLYVIGQKLLAHKVLKLYWTKITQHVKCWSHVSWAEIKNPWNIPYAQKAYFSQMLCTNLFTALVGEHFFFAKIIHAPDRCGISRSWLKQHCHYTDAPCAGDNKWPL